MGVDPTADRDAVPEASGASGTEAGGGEMSRRELERETVEPLPDREGTFNALSDQATVEQHPEAEEETTTRGGLDV